jgi:hypothetical protein
MVNRRQLLKFSAIGTASLTVLGVSSFSALGNEVLRQQFVDPNLSPGKIDSPQVSVWEHADLVTVRPSIDPSTWDWTPAIQALLNRGGNLLLPEKITYTVSTTLRMRSNTWLVINGTLKFADQEDTHSTDHLLMSGEAGDPRVNVSLSGSGTIDGNYQNRRSFAPTSGAYLFLARETTKLRIAPGLKFINAPSSAIAGVSCVDAVVAGADLRYIREHGIYFSTDCTGIKVLSNTLNDLAVGNDYYSNAIKLRNNCSDFLIQGNTVNVSPVTTPNVVRGIVLDESDNVLPIKHAICHDGKILDNKMLGLSTGIWFKGSLIDAAEADSQFEMRVEVARNTFEAKKSSPLYAGILDRVRMVDLNDNIWRNFKSGIYGGGVGAIALRRNKIEHTTGVSGDGIRMLDSVYNAKATPSRARGDITLIDNEVTGYNGVGAMLTVANAHDEIKRNKIVSRGRAISYQNFGLITAPSTGQQVVELADNPQITSTGAGVAAIFLSAGTAVTVKYIVADNIVSSASVGIAYSSEQNSSAVTNKIDAPIPVTVDTRAIVYRKGNYNSVGPIDK